MKISRTINPVHPSRMLTPELEARELTPEQADFELGLSEGTLAGVLEGASVTPLVAGAFERVWGTPAATWLRLQQNFDEHPKTHGGARPGAGRPASGLATEQLRITGTPEQLAEIKAWLSAQGRGNGARAAADALYRAAHQIEAGHWG